MPGVEAIMALAIFPFMASAAGGECSFSMYNEVHMKKHNRLGDDKLDCVSQIRMNLNQLDRNMAVYNESSSAAIVDFLHSTAYVQHRNNAEEELDNDIEVIGNVDTSYGNAIL
eukprot:13506561-Ditylum_brightwellii.AAC.1